VIQEILLAIIFTGAMVYLGRVVYRQFQAKTACANGCGKCSVVDFNKIESELKAKGL
jgi:hypothetical protein